MAKKKVKKRVVKKKSSRSKKKNMPQVKPTKNKIRLVLRDLLLFVILTLVSYMIYSVSSSIIYEQFFYLVTMILGFISLSFFVVLLILLFLKLIKKR